MLISLTGTPGTGKSSVAKSLTAAGWRTLEVSDLASRAGLLTEMDKERGSYDIDPDDLQSAVDMAGLKDTVLVGHLSHLVRNDLTIVLRCRPSVLKERLAKRNWPGTKVQENIEAEAIDIILMEALDRNGAVFEVDTTEMTSEEVTWAVLEIISGKTDKYRPGHVDWSEEVMQWY
ncbi:MAG TPA: adenylate kinase family protein [Methanomassiliicoccales archaeon]|nr:adenylate kinase family protein [Methanomassiliicoccales archaeon]